MPEFLDKTVGRKHPIHLPPVVTGNQTVIIFLTVNTHQRKPILIRPDVVQTLIAAWQKADAWLVGRYVVMPDHLHLFCAPRDLTVSLKRWVKFWKSVASQHWPRPEEQPVWQLDFWDTQLRRDDSYLEKSDYVRQNPVRKKLVMRAEDWPYAGELNALVWHDK